MTEASIAVSVRGAGMEHMYILEITTLKMKRDVSDLDESDVLPGSVSLQCCLSDCQPAVVSRFGTVDSLIT